MPESGSNDDVPSHADVEIAVNLTIPAVHAQVASEAIAANKHVGSEKLISIDRASGAALLEQADAASPQVGVAPDTVLGRGAERSVGDREAVSHSSGGYCFWWAADWNAHQLGEVGLRAFMRPAAGHIVVAANDFRSQASALPSALAGGSARCASSTTGAASRLRRIHLPVSITSGRSAASARQASHCPPLSDAVCRPFWRPGSSVASAITATGTSEIASAFRSGGASPPAGSRRLVSALKTVPRPADKREPVAPRLAHLPVPARSACGGGAGFAPACAADG